MAPTLPPEEMTFEQFRVACEAIVEPLRAISNHIGLKVRAENEHWLPTTQLSMSAHVYWGGEPFAWLSPPRGGGQWWVHAVGVPTDIERHNITAAEATEVLIQRLEGHIVWIRGREGYMQEADTVLSRLRARSSQNQPST